MERHWTERSIKDFIFKIAADFIVQLEDKMESENISQKKLAEKLKLTKGRVSQVLNHPGNLTIDKIVKYARALNMKVSIVAYEDNDTENERGPINSEVFKICWEKSGKPSDFWSFQEIDRSEQVAANISGDTLYMAAVFVSPEPLDPLIFQAKKTGRTMQDLDIEKILQTAGSDQDREQEGIAQTITNNN